ncbi:unnamed protein product, partial [Mesorhabditis belari]|uniref:Non-specific serine/threonine protein kinase n=1 Tax=Mesorhabditis belari TaxID=2138241 RepID=A0AAF3EZU3_9BILA
MSKALESTLTEEQRENCRRNRENALRIRAEKEMEKQLTDEQKQRVQANRERALRLREERLKEFSQQPTTSTHNDQSIKESGKPPIQTVVVRPPVRNALDQAAVLRPLQLQSPKPAGIPATNLPKPKSIVTMKILDENTIVINLNPYHELINDALRKVPSRRYDGKIRKNVIHIKDLRMCENLLQKLTQIDIVLESIPDDAFRVLTRTSTLQPVPDDLKQAVDPDLIKFAYDYQIEGIKFGIARNGKVLIADEMGLGKSIQALGIARFFKTEWPLVIVCPAAVTTTWRDAILRFLPHTIKIERIHLLLSKSVPMPIDRRSSTIVIMSYDQMKLREEELLKQRFQVYIFDESHQLKEIKAKKTSTAQKLCKFANHVILLSGTPALSKPAELYSQVRLIDPTLFPKFETFATRYCDGRPGNYGFEAKGCTNNEELSAILSKCVMIRRMKNDVSEKLPLKKRELIFIEDNKINLKLESLQMAKRLFERNKSSGGDIFVKNGSGEGTIVDYYRETGMAKATAVTEHVIRNYFANFEAGVRPERKVLIFAHHQIVLDTFEYEMTRRGVGFVRIDGTTSQATRGLHCDRFQIDDNCFVALLSITAAGVGINLTAGSIVIFAELTWTPGLLQQAEDRAHRVGQKEERNLLCKMQGTTEEEKEQKVEEKSNLPLHSSKPPLKRQQILVERPFTLESSSLCNLESTSSHQSNSPTSSRASPPSQQNNVHLSPTSSFRHNRPSNIIIKDPIANRLSTPGESIHVPPVLLSPVLSRPVRSSSAASSPLPIRCHQNSDSDGDLSPWRARLSSGGVRERPKSRGGTRPVTPAISPTLMQRSTSGSKLAAIYAQHRHCSSGSGNLLPTRALVSRTDSDVGARPQRRRSRRRPSFNRNHGVCSETSVDSCSSSSSNLLRMKSSLGHSDPQLSHNASPSSTQGLSSNLPQVRLRKDLVSQSNRGSVVRRSFNASTSPVVPPRCRSPAGRGLLSNAQQPSTSSGVHHIRTTAPAAVSLRSYSQRSGSALMAPHPDHRRWSLASLPSTSGYGTPGSNSAFSVGTSSQYSSSEQLCDMVEGLRVGGVRFDSGENAPGHDDNFLGFRPRSRSLTSPVKFGAEYNPDVLNRTCVYKERFPKAKQQMEEKLNAFVLENAPLSGGANLGESEKLSDNKHHRKSMVMTAEMSADPKLLRLIADGATRFLHHQIVEIASDCLARSRDDTITCGYFCEMSQRLDETLTEAALKTSTDSQAYLGKLVKQLLMIVSRPARLLECLEFDPDEFYQLLEEAEGVVREQLGSGSARVPDLPQYIIGKLGLDRDPLMDEERTGNSPPLSANQGESGPSMSHEIEKSQVVWPPPENKAPTEDDYETIRLVSNGAYGAVYLVRHRETRQRFALKKMNKQTLILRNQVDQVFAERDILTMADNPFVVSFYGSFETRHHLCMLMEYVEGGDCAALLKNAGTLPLDLTRLYVAETILAIEYLHSYGIVHRDLKPDNLLITAMGHIKLTDFGLSKIGLMNRTTLVVETETETQQFKDKQLCGTPEYIAPEVIIRQGYGKPVDWWALGVILYEFLVGIVPFIGDSPEDLFSKIISEDVEYPEGEEALIPEAEDLIKHLLEKNPVYRLGTQAGAPEITIHPFFLGLDFHSLLRQKAEFVPQLENEEDTSYFDTRADRYNHDAESGGEEDPNGIAASGAHMFQSFSTASPRHSICGIDPAFLPHQASKDGSTSPLPTRAHDRFRKSSQQSSEDQSTCDSFDFQDKYAEAPPIPTAVLLRRRFSSQRQTNLSSGTSSSGTTGAERGSGTACSSTDSSMDATFMHTHNSGHYAHHPLAEQRRSPLPRFAISCDPDDENVSSHPNQRPKELSPVEEATRKTSESSVPLQLVIPSASGVASTSHSPAHSVSSTSSVDGSPASIVHGHQIDPTAHKTIVIRKGPLGFGFTIRSVRVYLGEHSEYYTIEHMVTAVDEGSPAYVAGLRSDDLITHANGQEVHNLPHPELMRRLLGCGNELTLSVTPLSATSIREGAARKSVGKLARKKPKRPQQRRGPMEKKSRKPSSLLRRLSGKRPTEVLPGTSTQKQTFMPRSVSSQDGSILSPFSTSASALPSGPNTAGGTQMTVPMAFHKRLSDVGIREEPRSSPLANSTRPNSLHGLKGSKHPSIPVSTTKNASSPIPVSPLARTHPEQPPSPTRSPSPSGSKFPGRNLVSKLLHGSKN